MHILQLNYAFLPATILPMSRSRSTFTSLSPRDQVIVRRFRLLRDNFSGDQFSRLQRINQQPLNRFSDSSADRQQLTADELALVSLLSNPDFRNSEFNDRDSNRRIANTYNDYTSKLQEARTRELDQTQEVITTLDRSSDEMEAVLKRTAEIRQKLHLAP